MQRRISPQIRGPRGAHNGACVARILAPGIAWCAIAGCDPAPRGSSPLPEDATAPSAVDDPASARSASVASSRSVPTATSEPLPSITPSAVAPSGSARGPRPAIVATAPTGKHVALDVPLTVTFDAPADPASVRVTIVPPAETTTAWPSPTALAITPTRWGDGKAHHVTVRVADAAPVTWSFLTLSPPPAKITPGNGAPLVLTFDDGSGRPADAARLLDLLAEHKVKAIFFPTGQWAEQQTKIIERMRAEGHLVCNHTWHHRNLKSPGISDATIEEEIKRGAGAGQCPLFRPPFRGVDARVERIATALGYKVFLWDVDSRDWEGLPAEDMVNRILARVKPSAVVLFHMHAAATIEALKALLPRLKKAGYALTVPEEIPIPKVEYPEDPEPEPKAP